ncbi:hypothetical protein D9757_000373 [Collybiopsis confluens]|uniref:Uncharacterized protein n=1 Tax=Collybiopsis confluens TaxID=2823264 RepID=A0A8H5I309_9AGAR|nr:hypothetical protein D9757_000373 [Collybiopsis confluens]
MSFKSAQSFIDPIISMIPNYKAWIITFIAFAAAAALHQAHCRCCSFSNLDSIIKVVDQRLQGYENERASEAIFTWIECRCFRARFNRAYAQAQFLRFSCEASNGSMMHNHISPRHLWKRVRGIQSCYRDLRTLRQEMEYSAAKRIHERSVAVMSTAKVDENDLV